MSCCIIVRLVRDVMGMFFASDRIATAWRPWKDGTGVKDLLFTLTATEGRLIYHGRFVEIANNAIGTTGYLPMAVFFSRLPLNFPQRAPEYIVSTVPNLARLNRNQMNTHN